MTSFSSVINKILATLFKIILLLIFIAVIGLWVLQCVSTYLHTHNPNKTQYSDLTLPTISEPFCERKENEISQEDFDTYYSQFVDFLTDVYETGTFPTQQEIESNALYRKFTDYVHIDPCCGGPIRYSALEKTIIEKIELNTDYIMLTYNLYINTNGENFTCLIFEDDTFVTIKNGKLTKLTIDDITEGECLIRRVAYRDNGEITHYNAYTIFYIEDDLT